jgi:hypothetical protein
MYLINQTLWAIDTGWWNVNLVIHFTSKHKKQYKNRRPVSPVRVLRIVVLVPLPCPLCACCCPPLSDSGSNSSCHWCTGTAVCSTAVRCSSWTLLRFISCEPSTWHYNRCLKPPCLYLSAVVNKIKTNLFVCFDWECNHLHENPENHNLNFHCKENSKYHTT